MKILKQLEEKYINQEINYLEVGRQLYFNQMKT